jgi:hypothetical protein
MEVVKLILKIGTPMIGKFLIYGALNAYFDVMDVGKNPNCPLCGEKPTIKSLIPDSEDLNGETCAI